MVTGSAGHVIKSTGLKKQRKAAPSHQNEPLPCLQKPKPMGKRNEKVPVSTVKPVFGLLQADQRRDPRQHGSLRPAGHLRSRSDGGADGERGLSSEHGAMSHLGLVSIVRSGRVCAAPGSGLCGVPGALLGFSATAAMGVLGFSATAATRVLGCSATASPGVLGLSATAATRVLRCSATAAATAVGVLRFSATAATRVLGCSATASPGVLGFSA